MVSGQTKSNLKNLMMELLQPIKEDPETVIQKAVPKDKMKMYYMVKGLLPKLEFMFGLKVDPNHIILDMIDKLENITDDKWQTIETHLRGVLDGDKNAMEEIKKSIQL